MPPAVRRQQRALRANDFREAAQALARECFDTAPGRRGATGPPVVVDGGPAGPRRALAAAVQALWRLARADDPRPVTAETFAQVAQLTEQVKAAFAQGLLRWAYPKGRTAS